MFVPGLKKPFQVNNNTAMSLRQLYNIIGTQSYYNNMLASAAMRNTYANNQFQLNAAFQAGMNFQTDISIAQVAESAMGSINDLNQRIGDICNLASSDIWQDEDRQGMQDEIDSYTDGISSIVGNTSFNGINLIDGSFQGDAHFGPYGSSYDTSAIPDMSLTAQYGNNVPNVLTAEDAQKSVGYVDNAMSYVDDAQSNLFTIRRSLTDSCYHNMLNINSYTYSNFKSQMTQFLQDMLKYHEESELLKMTFGNTHKRNRIYGLLY